MRVEVEPMSLMELLFTFILITSACQALIVGMQDFRISLIVCKISGSRRRNFFSFRKKQFNMERLENNINSIDFSISLVKVTMFGICNLDIILL